MRPMFPNSAFVHAPESFVLCGGRWHKRALKVRYGLFIHPAHGPVLIDTGYGPQVTQDASRSVALKLYARVLSPHCVTDESPLNMLARQGFSADDVRFIILTHFHADHTSELTQFPRAHFFVDRMKWETIRATSNSKNLMHGIFTDLVPSDFSTRIIDIANCALCSAPLSLPQGRDLFGDGSALAIPLPGHAEEHFGVCFPREAPPLLYAVDTQWLCKALIEDRAPGFPASLVATNGKNAAASATIVRNFHTAGGVVVLCHDPEPTPYDAGPFP